jgi:hypothetical protein
MKIETLHVFQSIAKQLDGCAGKAAGDEVRAALRDAVRADGGVADDAATEFAVEGAQGAPAGA